MGVGLRNKSRGESTPLLPEAYGAIQMKNCTQTLTQPKWRGVPGIQPLGGGGGRLVLCRRAPALRVDEPPVPQPLPVLHLPVSPVCRAALQAGAPRGLEQSAVQPGLPLGGRGGGWYTPQEDWGAEPSNGSSVLFKGGGCEMKTAVAGERFLVL